MPPFHCEGFQLALFLKCDVLERSNEHDEELSNLFRGANIELLFTLSECLFFSVYSCSTSVDRELMLPIFGGGNATCSLLLKDF